jgi:hypothetical protein
MAKNYGLSVVGLSTAMFVAAGQARQARALLYRFRSDPEKHGEGEDFKFGTLPAETLPSDNTTGEQLIDLSEDEWNGDSDYWLGRYVLTDLVVKVPDQGTLLINDVTMNINLQKQIVKTALVGRKGTIKEYITDGDYQIGMTIGVVAVNSNKELIDQYPEKAVTALRNIFELNEALEVSSPFLDAFGINRIVVTGFSAKQMTYANRQVIEVTALSDDDYTISSTDY